MLILVLIVAKYYKMLSLNPFLKWWTLLVQRSKENEARFVSCALGIGKVEGCRTTLLFNSSMSWWSMVMVMVLEIAMMILTNNKRPKGKSGFFCDLCTGQSRVGASWRPTLLFITFPSLYIASSCLLQCARLLWQFGQIHSVIWANTFCHLDKIHFVIWTNTCCHSDKYVHCVIWTNTLRHTDKTASQ